MKKIKHFTFGLFATLSLSSVATAQIGTVDLSTGIDDVSSGYIPYGNVDDSWTASGPGSLEGPDRPGAFGPTRVCTNLDGYWAVAGCARWITPYLQSGGGTQPSANAYAGVCKYRRVFSLDPSCMAWAQVNFSYIGGDDKIIGFKLNGHAYPLNPVTSNDYNTLTQTVSFSVNTAHLMAGPNTIIIEVNNVQAYTGFFACGGLDINFCSPRPGKNKNKVSGLEDAALPTFKIVPNPGKGMLSLKLGTPARGYVEIADMTGRMVHRFSLREGTLTYPIDLSDLAQGIYVATIHTEQATETRKIILQ